MFNKPQPARSPLNPSLAGATPPQPSPAPARPAPAPAAEPAASMPVAKAGGVSDAQLIVGPNVKLKGAEILDCDTLVVEGRVEATMDSRVIRIAEKGAFSGKVSIDIAEVWGRFDGELTARNQLIVHATGKVTGKIRYGKILIEEGGEVSGEVAALSAERGERAERKEPPAAADGGGAPLSLA